MDVYIPSGYVAASRQCSTSRGLVLTECLLFCPSCHPRPRYPVHPACCNVTPRRRSSTPPRPTTHRRRPLSVLANRARLRLFQRHVSHVHAVSRCCCCGVLHVLTRVFRLGAPRSMAFVLPVQRADIICPLLCTHAPQSRQRRRCLCNLERATTLRPACALRHPRPFPFARSRHIRLPHIHFAQTNTSLVQLTNHHDPLPPCSSPMLAYAPCHNCDPSTGWQDYVTYSGGNTTTGADHGWITNARNTTVELTFHGASSSNTDRGRHVLVLLNVDADCHHP